MRTLTVYTDPIKPGVCELPPFILGDDTDWTLKFYDGTSFWIPTSVSMRVGYVNGLVPGTYTNAFKWVDRMNNQHVASFAISSGCAPGSLTWDENPLNVMGGNGAWLLRGRTPPSSSLRKLYLTEKGSGYSAGCFVGISFFGGLGSLTTYDTQKPTSVAYIAIGNQGQDYTYAAASISGGGGGGAGATVTVAAGKVVIIALTDGGQGYTEPPSVTIIGDGDGATASAILAGQTDTILNTVLPASGSALAAMDGTLASITLINTGAGYTSLPTVTIAGNHGGQAEASGIETHGVPFIRDPSSILVQTAVAAVPWWRGRQTLNSVNVYDDSLLIIRPSLVATAALSQAGVNPWSGTFNPVADFVNAVLTFRRACVMDLQIFGSGRLLYQGGFAVLGAIPTY